MSLRYDPESMSTGFPDIDAQHQELIHRLNQLLACMRSGRGQDELRPLLDFLATYSRRHFAHEEGCMAREHCSAAATNQRAHQQFVRMLEQFGQEVRAHGATVALVLRAQRELGEWVRTHIIRTDTQLRHCAGSQALAR